MAAEASVTANDGGVRLTADPGPSAASEAFLEVSDVEAIYGRSVLALRGLSLRVPPKGIVALLGANGAGKTTALKAISSLLPADGGRITKGTIRFAGGDVTRADPADLVKSGMAQVLEGRRCFPHLTVEENLIMGDAAPRRGRRELARAIEQTYAIFPKLRDLRGRRAGYLSGGEQQMLAIGRALMTRPRIVLLDEPSMGLAPQIVEEIFDIVRTLNQRDGVAFLVAEQNAALALEIADHGYVVENGRVRVEASASDLLARDDVRASYLGSPGSDGPSRSSRPRRAEFEVRSARVIDAR